MGGAEHNVLLVVEGEKAEKDLVEAMFAAFNPKATWYVLMASSHIHLVPLPPKSLCS